MNNDSLFISKQALNVLVEAAKSEPSWTDQVQAYSAAGGIIVGIIAGLLAWLSYRSTIKQQQGQITEQQEQLNALAKIAEGLTRQVNESKVRRRLEIRPNLTLFGKSYPFGSNYFSIVVENTGDVATDVECFYEENNQLDETSFSTNDGSTVIYPGKRQTIEVHRRMIDKSLVTDQFLFSIYFTDKDGNEYSQCIKGIDGVLDCKSPLCLGHKTDWDNPDSERAKVFKNIYYQILQTWSINTPSHLST